MNKTVVVGLSGGVDSSVAAYLLKKQGYQVIGLFMKNWEDDEFCPNEKDYQDVVAIAEKLEIPFYSVNFVEEYKKNVFDHFIKELKLGFTPNPDILCNREIKFAYFYEKAKSLGADFIATGHYAKVLQDGLLRKCKDQNKDQTYFLYAVKQKVLKEVLFPLADLTKPEIRAIAKEIGLITHDKKDSTGICFVGKRDFKEFICQYIPKQEGFFKTPEGKIIKPHDGYWFYTIGQRKGLEIGGQGEAWFVVDKDPKTNSVIVAQGENNPHLYKKMLIANEAHFIDESFELSFPFRCTAKIRYRQQEQGCTIIGKTSTNGLIIEFDQPQRAITPRQSIVFYLSDLCLGGAFIEQGLASD
jgi:tRNA-specific 2-thiouridylase